MTTVQPIPQGKTIQSPVANKNLQYATLYVGDLAPSVDETTLYKHFSQVGPISSIRVCRDAVTKMSLGYSYVNFVQLQDAERALDTLNNIEINNKPIRIMWSQKDPSLRKSGLGNVFIKNLDPRISHKEIYDTFSLFGNILSCKVATDENGKSKGFGFVHFESVEAAENAIKKMNGKLLGDFDNEVYVGKFIPKRERQKQLESTWTNVFVKNLPVKYLDEEEFRNLFKPFGNILSICVREPATSNPKDPAQEKTIFGFVNFEKHEEAVKAVEEMDNKEIEGRAITCCRAMKKQERLNELRKRAQQIKLERIQQYQGLNLYVKNLEDDVDDEALKQIFSPYGTIKSAKVAEKDGTRLGFGFVCFSTPEEANRALTELNGKTVTGQQKPLYVNVFEPREIRAQKLAQQFQMRMRRQPIMNFPPYFAQGVPPQHLMGHPKGRNFFPPQQGFGGQQVFNQNFPKAMRKGSMPHPNLQQQQENIIGTQLFFQIARATNSNELAGRITGMLLKSSLKECENLIKDHKALQAKIEEAIRVIEESKNKSSAAK